MPKKKFKCPKCDRTFSMPAHLGRHLNTIHRRKARKKVAKRTGAKAKRRVGRPQGVARKRVGRPKGRMSGRRKVAALGSARLLVQIQAYYRELLARREGLDAQIDAVARAITAMRAS